MGGEQRGEKKKLEQEDCAAGGRREKLIRLELNSVCPSLSTLFFAIHCVPVELTASTLMTSEHVLVAK